MSIPTTCGPPPSISIGSPGVTVRAKSAPSIRGSASTRSLASASGSSAGKIPPRIAPPIADVADQRAGVDAVDPQYAAVLEPVDPAALGVGRVIGVLRLPHDHPAGVDAVGLHRLAATP